MRIKPDVFMEVDSVARRLTDPKAQIRYARVEGLTGVPRNVIAVIHEREASQNWNTQLGQGDPLHQVSTHVPRGRGPFETWEDGACDALKVCPPFAATNKDWSIGGMLTILEEYNGLGYANKGVPSPYIWSGTDQYAAGKYIADGVYSPTTVDHQLGCAALLSRMMEMQKPPVVTHEPAPAPTSWLTLIVNFIKFILNIIFKRRP